MPRVLAIIDYKATGMDTVIWWPYHGPLQSAPPSLQKITAVLPPGGGRMPRWALVMKDDSSAFGVYAG